MPQRWLIGAAVLVAVCFTWLAWDGLIYLRSGYSLQVSMEKPPSTQAGLTDDVPLVSHIDFPGWRTALHAVLWVAGIAAIMACIIRPLAPVVGWPVFVATVAAAEYDIYLYGVIGAPTSNWNALLLLVVALFATFRASIGKGD